MKKVFLSALAISMLSVFACSVEKSESIPLPFYNTAEFTPEWIEEGTEAYNNIHRITDFTFTNQEGLSFGSSNLKGKIYVADFFFTICPSICPKMTSNLAKVLDAFEINDIQLVSFSVMPWVDSVSILKEYADLKGIDQDQWNLLTGPKKEIYQLARQSYFAEKEIGLDKDSNEFLHTENFVLVDQKGRIRGVYNGTLGLEVNRLITDIKTLLELG